MQKAMLVILDGFGIGKDYEGNCISLADTSTFDMLVKKLPSYKYKSFWARSWPSRWTNGKFWSRSFKYWSR